MSKKPRIIRTSDIDSAKFAYRQTCNYGEDTQPLYIDAIFPVRCITCGNVVGRLTNLYTKYLKEGYGVGESLDKLGLERLCCRASLMVPVGLPCPIDESQLTGNNILPYVGDETNKRSRTVSTSLSNGSDIFMDMLNKKPIVDVNIHKPKKEEIEKPFEKLEIKEYHQPSSSIITESEIDEMNKLPPEKISETIPSIDEPEVTTGKPTKIAPRPQIRRIASVSNRGLRPVGRPTVPQVTESLVATQPVSNPDAAILSIVDSLPDSILNEEPIRSTISRRRPVIGRSSLAPTVTRSTRTSVASEEPLRAPRPSRRIFVKPS